MVRRYFTMLIGMLVLGLSFPASLAAQSNTAILLKGMSLGSFSAANASLFRREIVRNLEVSATVYNVFDRHYRDPASIDLAQSAIEQNGRTFRVKATWKF